LQDHTGQKDPSKRLARIFKQDEHHSVLAKPPTTLLLFAFLWKLWLSLCSLWDIRSLFILLRWNYFVRRQLHRFGEVLRKRWESWWRV